MNSVSKKNVNRRRKRLPRRQRKIGDKSINVAVRNMLPVSTFVVWPPTRIFARIHWDYTLATGAVTTSLGELILAANNPNDPGQASTATQPVWYDQLQMFYNKYAVWGSKLEITASHNTTEVEPYTIVIYPTRSATGVTTLADSMGQKYARWKQGGSSTGVDTVRLNNYASSSKIFGRSMDSFLTNGNQSPGSIWYWVIAYQAVDRTTQIALQLSIRLTMDIEFADIAVIDESTLSRLDKVRAIIETKSKLPRPKIQHLCDVVQQLGDEYDHL